MIEQLARDTEIKQVAKKYGDEYADDIFQDALVKMLELPSEKLQQLEEDGGTRYYFRQVVYHLCMARHRQPQLVTLDTEPPDTATDHTEKHVIEAVHEELQSMHWYERELFLLHIDHAHIGKGQDGRSVLVTSSRSVQEDTGINYQSVCTTVKKVRNELRNRLLHRDF